MASKFAAGAASDDLRSLCECPVCFEPYKDPRLLKCGHQFCEKCLSGIIDQSPQQKICCPVCRDVTKPQNGDVKTLPRATLLQHMQDLIFCQPTQEALGQKCTKCNSRKPTRHCPECTAELSYLCDQCFAVHQKVKRFAAHSTVKFDPNLICPDHPLKQVENFCHTCDKVTCVDCLFDDHGDHKTEPLDELAEKQRQKLKDFLAKSSADTTYTNHSKIEDRKKKIDSEKEKQKLAVKNARSALKKLDSLLEKAENDMTSQFDAALDKICKYKTKAVKMINIRGKSLNLAKSLLGDDVSDPQVIIGSRDLHDLPDIGQIEITVPDVGDTISKMAADIQNMASGINIKQKKEVIDARATGEVGREEWKLEHVRDINVSGRVQGVCFNRKNKTVVIRDNDEQHQTKVYNTAGALQKKLGAANLTLMTDGPGYNNYSSIAIDTKRDLYLLTNNNGTLVRMEMDGRVKDTTKLGNNLCGVCYIPGHDQYAVTDYRGGRKSSVFLVSAVSLTVTRTLNDKLDGPSHVCTGEIHGTQTVVVSDRGDNIIYLYNMEGKTGKTYGPHTDIGKLRFSAGVSVDRQGRIIVCDRYNQHVLCVWSDKDGDHWECLLDKEQLGEGYPWCLDVDNDNRFLAVGLSSVLRLDTVKLFHF